MFDPWAGQATTLREKVFEHLFLGELTRALLRSRRRCEVLRAEFDGSGFDVALEAEGVLRHVQLKAMRADGKRANVDIHTALATKPSGCVIWMLVDPTTFDVTKWRWFGGKPGEPLPPLGNKLVKHSKANSEGLKAERPDLRHVGRGRFETISSMETLIERLFGDAPTRDILALQTHLLRQPTMGSDAPAWMRLAQRGLFDALPDRLNELEMVDFAHLVDGYDLAGLLTPTAIQNALCERRPDWASPGTSPTELWAAIFIEHRRLRFGDGEMSQDQHQWFDGAYHRLRALLQPVR
jgi:hypothetical protein